MVYPYYSARRSFYGHPILGCSRQYHSADKNSIYPGICDCLFANCRMDSVFWKLAIIIGVKQMLGGLDAKRLESYEARRLGGLE